MDTAITPYKVCHCFYCPGDKEYYCDSCPCDLCHKCKEKHVKNLKTIDHNVKIYREKFNYIPDEELCGRVFVEHCILCRYLDDDSPLSDDEKMLNLFSFRRVRNIRRKTKRLQHNEINLTIKTDKTNDCQRREVYETKRKQHRGTIHTIRGDAVFLQTCSPWTKHSWCQNLSRKIFWVSIRYVNKGQ